MVSRRSLILGGFGVAAVGCTPSADAPAAGPGDSTSSTSTTTSSVAPTTTLPQIVEAPAYSGLASPFGLGVASGDPDAGSVVLWTRLLTGDDVDYQVAVDVARDEAFADIVSSTVVDAPSAWGQSVHFTADGLDQNSWYWYRFRTGAEVSPVGRTRTMPEGADTPLRFAFSSCQNWESGLYGAHRHLAAADLDLFVWLGDYIYEYGPGAGGVADSTGERRHGSAEVTTLDGYRDRYAQYRSDPHLQAHHAARPWVITWDDHEVDNNHAGLSSEDDQDTAAFQARRQAAHQAWWEHMPVRLEAPTGQLQIYRSLRWGSLVDLHMLDGRQYRSPQPTDGEEVPLPTASFGVRRLGPTALDPAQSMLGPEQRRWLETQVANSTSTWNVLGNQVYMCGLNAFPGEVPATNTDSWDGYFGERKQLLTQLATSTENLIVLSGDFHSSTAADLRADPFILDEPIVGTELMAPAISSTFPPDLIDLAPLVLGFNPQVRHFEPRNGYMSCEVTADRWTTQLHILDDVTDESSALQTLATFVVQAGTPGLSEVTVS